MMEMNARTFIRKYWRSFAQGALFTILAVGVIWILRQAVLA